MLLSIGYYVKNINRYKIKCRFKMLVLVEDEVKACNFLLLDRAAKRIVGSTTIKIKAEMDKVCERYINIL